MKKFNVTVNGKSYEVEIEEVKGEAAAAPAAPAASVADDELREKIEAARQRIAAQVAANAEATKAAAEEVQEAVAE